MKLLAVMYLFLFCVGMSFSQKSTPKFYLPGTIKIDSNLFCDFTEVSNFNYNEYITWLKNIYSDSSDVVKKALPITMVWNKYDCLNELTYLYFTHTRYRNMPVVGVTLKQAKEFAKWRSNRVFHYYLIKNNVIKWYSDVDSTNYFTIEKYFTGNYRGIEPNKNSVVYPEYSIPSSSEQNIMIQYNDSIIKNWDCNSKRCKECFSFITENNTGINYCVQIKKGLIPFQPTSLMACKDWSKKNST